MKLKEIGEFGLLSFLNIEAFDDAYIISKKDKKLLFCCDTSISGRHFDLGLSSFYEIGYRACATSLSDIAAMGGIPLYGLIALGIPGDYETSSVRELYSGIKEMGDLFDMKIVGGDTIESERLIITVSILGEAEKPITRGGSRPGDLIGVTGMLGGARAGLKALMEKKEGFDRIKKRYLMPYPRIKEGLILKEFATSMIDISDGLIMDLYHLSLASSNGMSIKSGLIPIENGASFEDVFISDDYELLFTFPENKKIEGFVIGEVIEEKGVFLDGCPISPKGYEHFVNCKF